MLELTINAKSPAAITGAFKKIKEMTISGAIQKSTPVHLMLEAGTYHELIRYNMSNPIVIESVPGTKVQDCVVMADNCEAFHSGIENRAVFVLGPNVTDFTMKNFSIVNTHNKSVTEGKTNADSGEALLWNNTNGKLTCEGMHLEGRQNTLCVKGFSHFVNCYISGDTDFIYGDCDTALFEECTVFVREDNRGDYNGYAVKSTAFANKLGFVFSRCTFDGEKRKKSKLYVYRTEGLGKSGALKWWDSAAFIECNISENFDEELAWDDDMNLAIYPRGNALTGIREYHTKVLAKNGTLTDAETTLRNVKTYTLTDDDFEKSYASRFLILQNTPFAEKAD